MNDMRIIRIFIGSSIDKKEFEIEREKLGAFINGLNRKLVVKGIFIELYDCEQIAPMMTPDGSQKQHDDYIRNEADVTFFMFFRKAGEFTLHELQVARDCFVELHRPDIFTFFKVVGDDLEETEDIRKAVDLIANAYGHYYSKFSDVDTIKLHMLQYIADKLDDGSQISVQGGNILFNDETVDGISVDNVFVYQRNPDYGRLKNEISEFERAIDDAISQRRFDEAERLTAEKEEKEKLLAKLESDLLKTLTEMHRQLNKDNQNPMIIKAYQLLEIGEVKLAQELFPIDVLRSKAENLQLKKELHKDECRDLIAQARARIDALGLDLSNDDRFEMIEETFDLMCDTAFDAGDVNFIHDFAFFLFQMTKVQKAYNIVRRLDALLKLNPDICSQHQRMNSYRLMMLIAVSSGIDSNEIEGIQNEALKLAEKLFREDPRRNTSELFECYLLCGQRKMARLDTQTATRYYYKAIELLEEQALALAQKAVKELPHKSPEETEKNLRIISEHYKAQLVSGTDMMRVYYLLGVAEFANADYGPAIEHLTYVVKQGERLLGQSRMKIAEVEDVGEVEQMYELSRMFSSYIKWAQDEAESIDFDLDTIERLKNTMMKMPVSLAQLITLCYLLALYSFIEKPEDAEALFEQVIDICDLLVGNGFLADNYIGLKSICYVYLALMAFDEGDYEGTERYLIKSYQNNQRALINDRIELIEALYESYYYYDEKADLILRITMAWDKFFMGKETAYDAFADRKCKDVTDVFIAKIEKVPLGPDESGYNSESERMYEIVLSVCKRMLGRDFSGFSDRYAKILYSLFKQYEKMGVTDKANLTLERYKHFIDCGQY